LGIRCLLLFCFVSVINVGRKMHEFLALIDFDFDFDCLTCFMKSIPSKSVDILDFLMVQ